MKIKNACFDVDNPWNYEADFIYDDDDYIPVDREIDNYSKIKHDEEQEEE